MIRHGLSLLVLSERYGQLKSFITSRLMKYISFDFALFYIKCAKSFVIRALERKFGDKYLRFGQWNRLIGL